MHDRWVKNAALIALLGGVLGACAADLQSDEKKVINDAASGDSMSTPRLSNMVSGTDGAGIPDRLPMLGGVDAMDSGRDVARVVDAMDAGRMSCGTPGSLLCEPLRTLPTSLRETGFFSGFPDIGKRAPGVWRFEPDPPLWTDGLHKERAIVVPLGKKIDNSKPGFFAFPTGTILIKTFSDDGPASRRPVETRLIRRTGDAFEPWQYAVYRWNADATDAVLVDFAADPKRRTPVMVTIKGLNGGRPFRHDIPSHNDCADCHDKNARVKAAAIGFDEIRLAWTLPGASKNQLEQFWDSSLLTTRPPATPETITDPDPRVLRIKRWVFGNCAHCHNGAGIFDLRPAVFIGNTVGRPTDASGVTPPPGWLRVTPGNPERSVLFVQARRTGLPVLGGLRPMPPVGIDLAVETDSLEDLRQWIVGLAPKP